MRKVLSTAFANNEITVHFAPACSDPDWDSQVEAMPGGDLVQTTLWAATRQRIGFQVRHLMLHDRHRVPLAGCLIQYRRVLPGFWLGLVPRGPLLLVDQPHLAHRLIQELVQAAQQDGILLLIVQPPEGGEGNLAAAMQMMGFQPGGPGLTPDATVRIDLHRSEEEILRAVDSKRRNRIRQAMHSSLTWRESHDVTGFHRLHAASAARLDFAPTSLDNLRSQWELLAPKQMCRITEVGFEGMPIAGEWFTCFGGTVTAKLRGSNTSAVPQNRDTKNYGTFSVWQTVLAAKAWGAACFDFNGFDRAFAEAILSGQPTPQNVQSFSLIKRSFGGEVVLLPQSQFVFTSPMAQHLLGDLVPWLQKNRGLRRVIQRLRARIGGVGLGSGATI